MIDCREAVRRMWAYLEQELAARSTRELEAHLETCQRCCGELEFNRHMRELVADTDRAPAAPPEVRARIELLLAGPEEKAGGTA